MPELPFSSGNPRRAKEMHRHARYRDLLVTVVEPHGGATHVNRIYVNDMLAAIDEARRRNKAEEDARRNAP